MLLHVGVYGHPELSVLDGLLRLLLLVQPMCTLVGSSLRCGMAGSRGYVCPVSVDFSKVVLGHRIGIVITLTSTAPFSVSSPSTGCIAVPRLGFNLWFSGDWWHWTPFHALVSCVGFFFCAFQVLPIFYLRVVFFLLIWGGLLKIWDTRLFSDMCITNVFSHSWLPFHFLLVNRYS